MPVLGGRARLALRRSLPAVIVMAAASAASLTTGAAASSRPKVSREYDLKAAFLFNFAQFVEWPADAFSSPDSPITICVYGEDPFDGSLAEVVDREIVRGRRLVVRSARDLADASRCHILFIAAASGSESSAVLVRKLRSTSVLTVGETDAFESAGGIVRFVTVQNKLKLRINTARARSARITISSKLLRQAQIVGDRADP